MKKAPSCTTRQTVLHYCYLYCGNYVPLWKLYVYNPFGDFKSKNAFFQKKKKVVSFINDIILEVSQKIHYSFALYASGLLILLPLRSFFCQGLRYHFQQLLVISTNAASFPLLWCHVGFFPKSYKLLASKRK